MTKNAFVIASAVVGMMTIGYLAGQQPAGKAGTENADTAAVKKAGQSFLKAYLAGDAEVARGVDRLRE